MTHHVYINILTKIATFAPSLLQIRARALPIPRPAPVTRTRWPAKRAEDIIMEVVVMGSVAPMMITSRIESNFFSVMEEFSDGRCLILFWVGLSRAIINHKIMCKLGGSLLVGERAADIVQCTKWCLIGVWSCLALGEEIHSLLPEMKNAVPVHQE